METSLASERTINSHSLTEGEHPNILPRDSCTVPKHYSLGCFGSAPLMPLQLPFNQVPPPYMSPMTIPQWPSMITAQLLPSESAGLHDSRLNHEQIIHPQEQRPPTWKRVSRKLTDEQRQLICICHEGYKPATQEDIASKPNLPMEVYKSVIAS